MTFHPGLPGPLAGSDFFLVLFSIWLYWRKIYGIFLLCVCCVCLRVCVLVCVCVCIRIHTHTHKHTHTHTHTHTPQTIILQTRRRVCRALGLLGQEVEEVVVHQLEAPVLSGREKGERERESFIRTFS
jgi:hypothetical protein